MRFSNIIFFTNLIESCKCCIEKEIESLKHEIHKSKYNVDSPNEVVRAIEKYEKQKEILADHNQV